MENIELKKVSFNEIEKLQVISRQTFTEAFSSDNSAEDMKEYLGKELSIEQLKTELSAIDSEFYFAVLEGKVIGYLKINFGESQTDIKDENALEIERIYVLKGFYGTQVGQLLFDKAIEIAEQRGVAYVWLGVWEENPRAIRFYKKNGFVEFDKHIFKLGNDEQMDILMKLQME